MLSDKFSLITLVFVKPFDYFGQTVQYNSEQSVQLKRGSICGSKVINFSF
jgi:hypothetical protein